MILQKQFTLPALLLSAVLHHALHRKDLITVKFQKQKYCKPYESSRNHWNSLTTEVKHRHTTTSLLYSVSSVHFYVHFCYFLCHLLCLQYASFPPAVSPHVSQQTHTCVLSPRVNFWHGALVFHCHGGLLSLFDHNSTWKKEKTQGLLAEVSPLCQKCLSRLAGSLSDGLTGCL